MEPSSSLEDFAWIATLLLGMMASLTQFRVMAIMTGLVCVSTATLAWEPDWELGAITLYAQDIAFAILGFGAVSRLLLGGAMTALQRTWLALSILFLLEFLRGAMTHGVMPAGVGYRPFFYLSVGALYFSTWNYDLRMIQGVQRLWLSVAGALLLATLFLWSVEDFTWSSPFYSLGSLYEPWRVVNAGAALWMAQAALLSLLAWSTPHAGMGGRLVALALACVVVMLQHRSVWAALLGGGAVLTLLEPRLRKIVPPILLITTLGFLLLTLLLEAAGLSITTGLSAAVSEPFDDEHSTFAWRVEGWRILVERTFAGGFFSILLGDGFGVSYERTIGWGLTKVSPHNFFVQTFIQTGLAGTLGLLWFFLRLARGLLREERQEVAGLPLNQGSVHLALLVSTLLFSFTYSPGYEQSLLWGMAMVLFGERRRAAAPPLPHPLS
ncbi:MAG: hypothetical protein HQL51_16560, partial [Magnetococcales bacterium]|nr:hypothetical protein [Magnetococcales bacterium]